MLAGVQIGKYLEWFKTGTGTGRAYANAGIHGRYKGKLGLNDKFLRSRLLSAVAHPNA
jgi:hypothetical protein